MLLVSFLAIPPTLPELHVWEYEVITTAFSLTEMSMSVTTFKVTGIWIVQFNRLIRIMMWIGLSNGLLGLRLIINKTYIVIITRFDKFSSQAYNWTFVWKKFDRNRFRSDKNCIKLVKFQTFATCAKGPLAYLLMWKRG